MKGKKAMNAYDMVYWVARILFAILLLVTIFFLARFYEQSQLQTAGIEAGVFRNYLLYSPSGISYHDIYTNRVYPGVIDINKINSQQMEDAASFGSQNNAIAAKITLMDTSKESSNNLVKSAYYNKQQYDNWLPLSGAGFSGVGTVMKADNSSYVLYVDDNGDTHPGILLTEILVPNS